MAKKSKAERKAKKKARKAERKADKAAKKAAKRLRKAEKKAAKAARKADKKAAREAEKRREANARADSPRTDTKSAPKKPAKRRALKTVTPVRKKATKKTSTRKRVSKGAAGRMQSAPPAAEDATTRDQTPGGNPAARNEPERKGGPAPGARTPSPSRRDTTNTETLARDSAPHDDYDDRVDIERADLPSRNGDETNDH